MKFDKVSGYTMNENDSPDRKETGKFCLDQDQLKLNMNLKSLEIEPSGKYICQN